MAREVGRTREASGARRLRLLADQAPRRFRFFFSSSLLPSFVVPFFPRACGAMLPRHTCNSAITVCDGYKWLFPRSIVRPPAMALSPGVEKKEKGIHHFHCLLQRLGHPPPAIEGFARFAPVFLLPQGSAPALHTHSSSSLLSEIFWGGLLCCSSYFIFLAHYVNSFPICP